MDGLMLDTERSVVALWLEVCTQFGREVAEEAVVNTIGIDEASTKAALMDACGPEFPYDEIRKTVIGRFVERAEAEGVPHRPGLLVLLDRLSSLGIPLGVATSADRDVAVWKLRRARILERFDALACGDEVSRGKPEPDVFLLAAERLGKKPAECIGFEDSPAGLKALHSADIRSVFIKDMVEPPAEILRTVWRRCGDLAEAAALFGGDALDEGFPAVYAGH
jgi:HAD superfamily hydrolase (TIGR01509 family)